MPCDTYGCVGAGAPREDGMVAPLVDLEKTPAEWDPVKKTAERAAKFIFGGLLILLCVHIFNSMCKYAINYIGGDTWFTEFAVIAVAVPIAEITCILGQTLVPSLPMESSTLRSKCACACIAKADCEPPREDPDALFLNLEKGYRGYTKEPLPAVVITKIADDMAALMDAHNAALDLAVVRIIKCTIRVLLVLHWVYLIDLVRRYVTALSEVELIFMCPMGIVPAVVSLFLFFLMESFGECISLPI